FSNEAALACCLRWIARRSHPTRLPKHSVDLGISVDYKSMLSVVAPDKESPSWVAPRSHVPRVAETRDGRAGGRLRVHAAAQPRFLAARRARRRGRETGLTDVQQSDAYRCHAEQRRRV